MTIDEIRRNQEKKEKELREQREREKSEAEAFEMVRILWGLDEVSSILRNNDIYLPRNQTCLFFYYCICFIDFITLIFFSECDDG